MKIFVLSIFIFLGFTSCKNEPQIKQSKSQELFLEIMVIHDEVMPMMSEVHRQKRALVKIKKDTINNTISKDKINRAIQALEKSDEGMMGWMAKFDSNKQNDNRPESVAYLLNNKKIISEISIRIKKSIKEAKILIANEK